MSNDFEDFNVEDSEADTDVIDAPQRLAPGREQMQSDNLADVVSDAESQSWSYRSKLAPFESEKEFLVFKFWLEAGSGRSKQYISKVYNYTESTINKIAIKNNWDLRAAEYDRFQLQLMSAAENSRRAQLHKQKLEEYRQQQEFIGRSLSSDAAKLAAIVSNTLDKFMMNDREIDIRDLPAVLNAANKAAEVGRNLQSSSLGVDQLLTALEEVED